MVFPNNGVGRQKAKELNLINKPTHISYGIQISKERIEIYNRSFVTKAKSRPADEDSITITDLFENNVASGTRVEVKFKSDDNV